MSVRHAAHGLAFARRHRDCREEVVVCRGKQPVARVVPYTKTPRRRPRVGVITSKPVRWAPDCFEPLSGRAAEEWGL